MKTGIKYCILFSLCLVSQTGNAQLNREWTTNYTTPDTAYMNVIGLYDAGNGNVLKATLITKYSSPDTYNRLLLQKIAPAGTTIWEESYQHPQYDQFFLKSGGIDQNGNTYFSGQVTVNQSETNWFVISFDANGQERWQKGIVENFYSSGGSHFSVTDLQGNTYASGNVGDNNGFSSGAIVKYDQAGNEQWVNYDPTDYNYGADMIIAANGDLIACDGQYELTRFAPNGTITWSTPDTTDFVYATPKIAEAPDGSIYALTYLSYSYSLKKLNANGVFQWNQNQFAQNMVFADLSLSVHTDSESNIYLAGINSTDQSAYQTAIFKFNPQGTEIWNQGFSAETNDVTDILLLDNDQIALAASEYSGGQPYTTVYLVNKQNGSITDSDSLNEAGSQKLLLQNQSGLYLAASGDFSTILAKYAGTLSISEHTDGGELLVYPNPFTNEVTIRTTGESARFECTDLAGKILQSGSLNQETNIFLPDLAPGMYHLTVTNKNGNTFSQRIVKATE